MNEPLFDYVAKQLRAEGFTVMNPWDLNRELYGPHAKIQTMSKAERAEMRKVLLTKETAWIINVADRVVLLPGWERSPGAVAERAVAIAVRKPVHELPNEVSLMQENAAVDIDVPVEID
jgi:hypothetical protein